MVTKSQFDVSLGSSVTVVQAKEMTEAEVEEKLHKLKLMMLLLWRRIQLCVSIWRSWRCAARVRVRPALNEGLLKFSRCSGGRVSGPDVEL